MRSVVGETDAVEHGKVQEMPEDLVGREIVHEPQAGFRIVDRRRVVALQLLIHEFRRHVHRVAQPIFGGRTLRPGEDPLAFGLGKELLDRDVALGQHERGDAPVLQHAQRLQARAFLIGGLVHDRLKLIEIGDERLAARGDILRGDRGDPALTIGVVQTCRR